MGNAFSKPLRMQSRSTIALSLTNGEGSSKGNNGWEGINYYY